MSHKPIACLLTHLSVSNFQNLTVLSLNPSGYFQSHIVVRSYTSPQSYTRLLFQYPTMSDEGSRKAWRRAETRKRKSGGLQAARRGAATRCVPRGTKIRCATSDRAVARRWRHCRGRRPSQEAVGRRISGVGRRSRALALSAVSGVCNVRNSSKTSSGLFCLAVFAYTATRCI